MTDPCPTCGKPGRCIRQDPPQHNGLVRRHWKCVWGHGFRFRSAIDNKERTGRLTWMNWSKA